MHDILHQDFETYSAADLTKVGLDIYGRHPTTGVWCMAYAFNDEPPELWVPGQPLPRRVFNHFFNGGEVWAHNAAFEIAITNNICAPRFHFPSVTPHQYVCTMAMAYAMALPGSLEKCAAALGVDEQKDMAGHRLMLQMAQPRAQEGNQITWWDDPEKQRRLQQYCLQDIIVERKASKRMLTLAPKERALWQLDQKINAAGITVDVEAIEAAFKLVESEKVRTNAEMQKITEGAVATCTAVQQIKNFLEFYGIPSASLDKEAVAEHLTERADLHPVARRVLELRAEAGKAATSKFAPMLTGAGSDHRLRGTYQFSGANTRRWSSRRIQLHNLKRPTMKPEIIDRVILAIKQGMDAETLECFFGKSAFSMLAECVRGFLIAPPGFDLMAADFNAIEARVLAWLAGQESTLEVFRRNLPIYKITAADIFNCAPDKVTDEQRQVGKVANLALGYQGGVGALQKMAKGYRVKLAPALPNLWTLASDEQRAQVEKHHKEAGSRYEISKEEFIASDLTKIFWRAKNPAIVEYWAQAEHAAMMAVLNPGNVFGPGEHLPAVKYKKVGSFLWCLLPSGGTMCYPYPEIRKIKTPWGAEKDALTYMSEDAQSKKWIRFATYGGSEVENITQSVARDVEADAMLRLDNAGYKIVLHTHDEIVCEVLESQGNLNEMSRIMAMAPEWAPDLPIAAAGWRGKRYRK